MSRHVILASRPPEAAWPAEQAQPLHLTATEGPITHAAWLEFFALVRDVRKLQQIYRRTLDVRTRVELVKLEDQLDVRVATITAVYGESAPPCPQCGMPMTAGAPHGPWPVQWECHRCGTIVVPPSQTHEDAALVSEGRVA